MPAVRAELEELRDEGGVDVGALVEDDEDPRPAVVGAVVGARAHPGDRHQLADHVGGGDLVLDDVAGRDRRRRRAGVRQPLRPRAEALRLALDDDDHEVLGAVQRGRLEDHRRAHRPHVAERAVEAEHAELGEVDADRARRQAVVAGDVGGVHASRRYSSPAVSGSTVTWERTVPIPSRVRRNSSSPRWRDHRSSVRSVARRARSARSGDWSMRSARSSSSACSTSAWRFSSGRGTSRRLGELALAGLAAVPDCRRHRQRRQHGHHHEHRRAGQGEHASPATIGSIGVIIEKRRFSGRVGTSPSGLNSRSLDDDRLVRRAAERDLAELVALGVGRPTEDAQGDGGGAELDDVVGADDGGVGDRAAVDGERVGRRRIGTSCVRGRRTRRSTAGGRRR